MAGTASAAPPAAAAGASPPPPALDPERKRRADEYERLIAANPKARAPYLQLAKVYLEAGHKDLAAQAYRRYLKIDPGNHYVRSQLDQLEGKAAPSRGGGERSASQYAAARGRADRTVKLVGLAAGAVAVLGVMWLFRESLFPSARAVSRSPYPCTDPSFSPDGRRLVWRVGRPGGAALAVNDLETGKTREFDLPGADFASEARWSPDGLEILVEGYAEGGGEDGYWGPVVRAINVLDGSLRQLARGSDAAYSSDGKALILLCPGERPHGGAEDYRPPYLCRLDLLTGSVKRLHDGRFDRFAVQPGGDLVLFEVGEEVDWEKVAQELPAGAAGVEGGDPLKPVENVVEGAGNIRDLDVGMRREEERLRKEAERERGRQQDGSWWMPPADLHVVGADGSGHRRLTADGRSTLVGWTPDGRWILFLHRPSESARPELWRMDPDGGGRRQVLPPDVEVIDTRSIAITPDGRHAIYVGLVEAAASGAAMLLSQSPPYDLYELELGEERPRRLENRHPFKYGFALAPDGRRIAYEAIPKESGQPGVFLMRR